MKTKGRRNSKKNFQKMMVAVCCSCLTISTVQLVSAEEADWSFWQSYYAQQSAADAYNDVSNGIIFDDGSSLSEIIDNGQGYFGSYLEDMDQDGADELVTVGSWYVGGGTDAAKMEVWIYDYENGQIIGTKAYQLYYAGSDSEVMQTTVREVTTLIHEKSDGDKYVMVLEKGRRAGSDMDYVSSNVIEYDGPGQIKEMVNISSAYKEYEEENLFDGYTEEKAVLGLNDLRSEASGDLLIADLKRESQSDNTTIRTEYKSLSSVAEGYSTRSGAESSETENADVVNQYLEFVKQYEGEAFYSIENIKEGNKPILLMTFLTKDAWDYEFIDEESVHSSNCDIYDCINGDIVKVGSLISFAGYLSLYEKEDNFYISARNNAHSYCFNCVKDHAIYTYGYNTNNIEADTVDYEENGEYYNYAYGTTNYDDAIKQYSEVGCIAFKKLQ